MTVATIPAYDDMWVHPAVVAALSDGLYVYLPVEAWEPQTVYTIGDQVLAGDCAYGGCIYRALSPSVGVDPDEAAQVAWLLDDAATIERLRLYTATTQATWLLDTLTGYRLHGEECWQEDYQVNTCTIRLRRGPVADITSVLRVRRCNVVGAEVANWCRSSQQEISVCCGGCSLAQFQCGCQDNVVRVTYRIESNLPPGTEAVAAWLAVEYGKAASGKACALPERITSVTRQGVSWTILDPQDFYDKGFTGMARVDNWLAPVKRTMGGTLIDPLTSNRLFSLQVDCAAPGTGDEADMVPDQLDLTLYAGDGFAMRVDFTDRSTGSPEPVGGTWKADIVFGNAVVMSWRIDPTNAGSGSIVLSLLGEEVAQIPSGAVWDLEQTPLTGEPRTWYRGEITVVEDVTQ